MLQSRRRFRELGHLERLIWASQATSPLNKRGSILTPCCTDLSHIDLKWGWCSNLEVGSQELSSSQDFQFIQTPPVESYGSPGPYDSTDLQTVSDNLTAFYQPEDPSLLSGVVSQGNFDDPEVDTDFGAMDTTDTRESSAFLIDQSPWADSVVTTEATTASTTPQAAVDGTRCEEVNNANDTICDTCFGMVGTESAVTSSLTSLLH